MDLTRNQFIRLCAGTLAAAALPACGGSSSDKPPGTPPVDSPIADAPKPVDAAIDARPPIDAAPDGPPAVPNCQQNGTKITIDANHGHAMTVSKADVVAGAEKIYDIEGVSGHVHLVTVTAAMFTVLQNNMQVTVSSSNDGHIHDVTIACA